MQLIVSQRYSDDARLLSEAARLQGWRVHRAQGSTLPADVLQLPSRVYAEGFLVEHFAAQAGLKLLRPADDALATLEPAFLSREVLFCTVQDFQAPWDARFIKPADQKLFPAAVYPPGAAIPGWETLDPSDPLLISMPVTLVREYRFFVLDAQVQTGSLYWDGGQVPKVPSGYEGADDPFWEAAWSFAQQVCSCTAGLGPSYVIDVGQLRGGAWAVIEFNPTWASGLYGSSPDQVLSCLTASQRPEAETGRAGSEALA
ncbi:ATP-grasp domain-containing protein [Deinococcus arcticus]|uniref:ATP-grasp domain-containing protein n=1 Tax=Deinococcus arcticus TaxID=2136176 RepID=UPI001304EE29|nr:ATP-grasp domain-containing protein [Deinococcus arcticus]